MKGGDPSPLLDFESLPEVDHGHLGRSEWAVAWGHLRAKSGDAALSVVSVLAILGVLLSVASMNVVVSVMTGFSDDLRDKILGANAHIVTFRYGGGVVDYASATEAIEEVDGVEAASPFVFGEYMMRSNWAHTGVIVKGIDPTRVARVTHVQDDLTLGIQGPLTDEGQRAGVIEALGKADVAFFDEGDVSGEPQPLPGILIGQELAGQLQVAPGDSIQLINPVGGGVGPMGLPTPSVMAVTVLGVFDSGMYEYDTKWAYMSIRASQDFLKMGDTVTGIEVRVSDIDDVETTGAAMIEALGYPYYTRNWKELNGKLFEALEMEKWVARLLFIIVVSIAGCLIVSTLLMVVLTKGREIAILKAMGATNRSVMRIFMMQGSAIGLAGTCCGTVIGLAACEVLRRYPIPISTDVYYVSTIPVVVEPHSVVGIALAAFLTCFFLTMYPAWRASSLDPVQALRYE